MSEFADRVGAGQRQSDYHRVAGTSRPTLVRHDADGLRAGKQVDHWDGRQSAVVRARTVVRKVSLRDDLGMSSAEADAIMRRGLAAQAVLDRLQARYGRLKPASQVRKQPKLLIPGRA